MTAKASAWLAGAIAAAALLILVPMPPAAAQPALSQPQLEQLAAPIALYPDELIAQVLDAAQYPQDVAAASSWRSTFGAPLTPGETAAALRDKPWAASVKALVDVPDVLYAMSNDLAWTEALGRAHAGQDAQLLAAIQDLRRRAQAAGTLRSVPQQVVEDDGQDIVIYPAAADGFYVPTYDPSLVYGAWPWSDYPPFFFGDLDDWGPGIAFTTIVFVGPHWHHRHMHWDRRGHWHERGVAAGVGSIAVPAAPAVVARAPAIAGTLPARRVAIGDEPRWHPHPVDHDRGAPPPAPATLPYPAPPRFPAPRIAEPPPVRMAAPAGGFARQFRDFDRPPSVPAPARMAAPPVVSLPAVRMAAPSGGFAREFGGVAESRSFTAPAEHGAFRGGQEGGRWRR